MHSTTKRSSALLTISAVLALALVYLRLLWPASTVTGRPLLLVAIFLPFPWFIGHFFRWLKYHAYVDDLAVWHSQSAALAQERLVHRSQVIASIGGLYFLILAATWVITNAL